MFENCKFENVNCGDQISRFTYCKFEKCELGDVGADFLGCDFHDSKIHNLYLLESNFNQCVIECSNLIMCELKVSEIEVCKLQKCEVTLSDLKNSNTLRECNISQTSLKQSEPLKVEWCNFYNCSYQVNPPITEFKHCFGASREEIKRIDKLNSDFIKNENKIAQEKYEKDLRDYRNHRDIENTFVYRERPKEPYKVSLSAGHKAFICEDVKQNIDYEENDFEGFIFETLKNDYSIKNFTVENGIIAKGELKIPTPTRLAIEKDGALEKIAELLCL